MRVFYFTRADSQEPFTEGDRIKILVPRKFGGGHVTGIYEDGGRVRESSTMDYINLYGLLAYWNGCEEMEYYGGARPRSMKEILDRGQTDDAGNICKGIEKGLFESQIKELDYPLKLVSVFCPWTYEDCQGVSAGRARPMETDIKVPQGRYKKPWNR